MIHIDRVVAKDHRRRLLRSRLPAHQDVVDLFHAVVRTFRQRQLPAYDILAAELAPVLYRFNLTASYLLSLGWHVPSNTTTYQLDDIQNTLKAQTGGIPHLDCGSNAVLQEVWNRKL